MKLATTIQNIIPQKALPNHQSEMVNQILFGEVFEILKSEDIWHYVRLLHDNYCGWVHSKQVLILNNFNIHKHVNAYYKTICADLICPVNDKTNNLSFFILLGSNLINFSNNLVHINENKYNFGGISYDSNQILIDKTSGIIDLAQKFLNTPYLWGGRTLFGIDCSGFTQLIYRMNGIWIDRDAKQQAFQGTLVKNFNESRKGDLAFFGADTDHITHVGILMNKQQIIHSSGIVRIDQIDDKGIYYENTNEYTHKLLMIKTYY